MKAYMYISKVNKLSHLSRILVNAKRNNKSDGITGSLSYNRGYYLQIIEGEKDKIELLMEKIREDDRHYDVQEIFDIEIGKRYFSGWAMNLVPLLKRNESFLSFMKECCSDLTGLTSAQQDLLANFYDIAEHQTAVEQNPVASQVAYSIDHWPNFSAVQPTPSLLSLCGTLLNNPTDIQALISKKIYESESQLKSKLKQLDLLGCLNVSNSMANTAMAGHGVLGQHRKVSFFDKMRDFLNIELK